MLRITQQRHAAAARSYYTAADYYREGQELAGVWGGKGAELLGLEGQVEKTEFDRLCENQHPATGASLTPRRKDDRTIGYDFTWSVPKSVSLLYALTKDEKLLDAFKQAVDETMQDIEEEMKTRVRKGGVDVDRLTGNAVWATFVHTTSRPVDGVPDPQLHAHCFVFNTTWDPDENRFKAGQFRDLKRDAPYWQAAMRNRLANHLQDLGLGIERKRDDFEIAGIAEPILKKYSRRTALIEQEAAERGIEDPDRKAELGAKTRESKKKELSWQELDTHWRERLTPPELAEVVEAYRNRNARTASGGEKDAVDHALLHCFERNSVVPEKELRAEALRYGLGRVEADSIAQELARRRLIGREVAGRMMLTSPDILSEEERIVEFAREGRGGFLPLGGFDRALTRPWLNDQQKKAVRHLWESPDRVMLIRGAAGTGKTTLMQEAVEGIEAAGSRVVALAPSAAASRGALRDAGMVNADTVSRFLKDEAFQEEARGGVILIDEASLLGSRTLAHVFDLAAHLDSRVILVGDVKQHAAIERGAAFRLLQERAGVPVVEVTDIRRQKGQYKQAIQALSDGRALEGFDLLERMGCVEELHGPARDRKLVDDYLKAVLKSDGRANADTVLVVSPTHAEIARITGAIRQGLKDAGKLGDERRFAVWTPASLTEAERADAANLLPGDMLQFHQNAPGVKNGSRLMVECDASTLPLAFSSRFQVYHPAELKIAEGDRLRITVNGKTKDGKHRLENGSLFSVKGFTPAGDIVVDKGWIIARDFGHLAHGFAVTSVASQGKTVDRVFISNSSLSFPASSREQFYVSASRGKSAVKIYTDDKQALRDVIQRSDPKLSAMDLMQPKQTALAPGLKRHLAFMRRLANIPRVFSPSLLDRAQPRRLEVSYER